MSKLTKALSSPYSKLNFALIGLIAMSTFFLPLVKAPFVGKLSFYEVQPLSVYFILLCLSLCILFRITSLKKYFFVSLICLWISILWNVIIKFAEKVQKGGLEKLQETISTPIQTPADKIVWKMIRFQWGAYICFTFLTVFTILGIIFLLKRKKYYHHHKK